MYLWGVVMIERVAGVCRKSGFRGAGRETRVPRFARNDTKTLGMTHKRSESQKF
jgi:hypothetical protein